MLELIAMGIAPAQIHTVDDTWKMISGNCNLSGKLFRGKFPAGIKAVYGDLEISHNLMESLENCPEFISGTFSFINTRIRNLKGGPRYVGILCASDNPLLESLDYAPVYGRGMYGDLFKTAVPPEEVAFYIYANEKKLWNSYFSLKENVAFACREYPEVFSEPWELLDEFRGGDSETRGRAAGINVGIL